MPTIRAKVTDVVAQVKAQLQQDALAAAGNSTLSRSEQATLPAGDVLAAAAADVRAAKGRVTVDDVVADAVAKVEALVAAVNTRGPASLSVTEVKKLAVSDAAVGARVAKAYELITGKHVDLGGTTGGGSSSSSAAALANLVTTVQFSMGLHASLAGGALVLKGMAGRPVSLALDVAGSHVKADVTGPGQSMGGVGSAADPRDLIEALRAALPASLALRVKSAAQGKYTVDFWPAGQVPPVDNAPQYGALSTSNLNIRMSGPLAFKGNAVDITAGMVVTMRIDDKVYQETALVDGNLGVLRDLKRAMEADGRTVVFHDYGGAGFTFRVTG